MAKLLRIRSDPPGSLFVRHPPRTLFGWFWEYATIRWRRAHVRDVGVGCPTDPMTEERRQYALKQERRKLRSAPITGAMVEDAVGQFLRAGGLIEKLPPTETKPPSGVVRLREGR